MNFNKILMVRHGAYDRHPAEKLNEEGERQSARALDELIQRGIGSGAILLSSTAPRALQTAAIIGTGLSLPVNPSRRIEIIGNDPDGVSSLDTMLESALSESGLGTEGDALVVVTHQLLIEMAARRDEVDYGEVWPYEPGTWSNPYCGPSAQRRLQVTLADADLTT